MPGKVHKALTPAKSAQLALDSLKEQRTDVLTQLDRIQTELDDIASTDVATVLPLVEGSQGRASALRIVAHNLDIEIGKVEAELNEAVQAEGEAEYHAATGEVRMAALSVLDGLNEALAAVRAAQAASTDAARARKKWRPSSLGFALAQQFGSTEAAIKNEQAKITQWLSAN